MGERRGETSLRRILLKHSLCCAALSATLLSSGCSTGETEEPDPGTPSTSAPNPTARSPAASSAPPSRPSESMEPWDGVAFGMAAPAELWGRRLAEVGDVQARRVFGQLGSPEKALQIAREELAAGRMPVVSFKVPGTDWAGAAAGRYDERLRYVTRELAAPGGRVFLTLHHEPASDGTPTDYAAMMRHTLPILSAPENIDAGPILNGFWWSNTGQGLSDVEIARWLPPDVLAASELVAADTYQTRSGDRFIEGADTKIVNFSAWARRVGVERLGVAEYNSFSAAELEAAGRAVLADPRMEFALVYNSNMNGPPGRQLVLSGSRLDAFQRTLEMGETPR